ncbi:MAG TPA: FAD-dependent oxidoreductase, partial [Smithellaceae bacterium]|nr:FAD-dependent oxidoreductase [Smithellaceae bacterium]
PCVGMVGGKIFFRGEQEYCSAQDVQLVKNLPDEEWGWLQENLKIFLQAIGKKYLFEQLAARRADWQLLLARKPFEKPVREVRPLTIYRKEVWENELGKGGLIGDLTSLDRTPIGLITTGTLRRYVPSWENGKYLPPCQANCPTGIPVQKRWELIRNGKMQEAVNLALEYTPFPATVCGYLCPNLCMQNCTRHLMNMESVDVALLGKASLHAEAPAPLPPTGRKIAVIGGGAAGLSVAWQLRLRGHEVAIVENRKRLGGKITEAIPASRIPSEVVAHEIARIAKSIRHINLNAALHKEKFRKLKNENDFIVIAAGASQPRQLNVPGMEKAFTALDFLRQSKQGCAKVGEKVVIIGAGNVGCDAASEAYRLGAKSVILVDVQKPASFGAERKQAEAAGARFLWPRFTKAITARGVELTSGEILLADTVIVAVGDMPDLSFLPEEIATERGFVLVDENYATSDPQVYAIGDAVRPGLLTDAIGAGRIASRTIDDILKGASRTYDKLPPIDYHKVKLEYFDPRIGEFADTSSCAANCASCGACRDCGMCEEICPQKAISRQPQPAGGFTYVADSERCIGCGFCVGACPTGVWELAENEPLE